VRVDAQREEAESGGWERRAPSTVRMRARTAQGKAPSAWEDGGRVGEGGRIPQRRSGTGRGEAGTEGEGGTRQGGSDYATEAGWSDAASGPQNIKTVG